MRCLITLGLLLWAVSASAFTVNGKTLATWNGKTIATWNGVAAVAAPTADTGVSGWILTNSGNFADANLADWENAYIVGGNPLQYYFACSEGIVDPGIGAFWIQMSKNVTIRAGGVISCELATVSNDPSLFSGTMVISNTDGSNPVTVFVWDGDSSTQTISSDAYAGNKKVTVRAIYNGGYDVDGRIKSISIPIE